VLRAKTVWAVIVATCAFGLPAVAPVAPLTPCEIVRDLPVYDGKSLAVVGRYSFREKGRWVSEQTCATADPQRAAVPVLSLIEDLNEGPKPPEQFELDGLVVQRKWAALQKSTQLGKFRFGTPDYDRWAVIWGRVQARKGEDAKTAAANFIYRGNGVIFYLTP